MQSKVHTGSLLHASCMRHEQVFPPYTNSLHAACLCPLLQGRPQMLMVGPLQSPSLLLCVERCHSLLRHRSWMPTACQPC